MPIEVNVDERLRAIADATFAVAARQGVDAISYRTVARELGSSTTAITNYLPTRAALLRNALDRTLSRWQRDMVAAVATAPPGEHLRTLAIWSCTTEPQDLILRHMFIQALAEVSGAADVLENFTTDAMTHRQALLDAALDDCLPNPEQLVDAVFLLCRGFYLSTVESRDTWSDDRAARAIDALLQVTSALPASP